MGGDTTACHEGSRSFVSPLLPGGGIVTCGFLEQTQGGQNAAAETTWQCLHVKSCIKLAATSAEKAISREGYFEEQQAALMAKTSEAPLIRCCSPAGGLRAWVFLHSFPIHHATASEAPVAVVKQ